MKFTAWEALPEPLRCPEVRPYYEALCAKKGALLRKRFFDILFSGLGIVLLSPFMLVFALLIKCSSPGPVFFRQERVTQYQKRFCIHKFRTMYLNEGDAPLTVPEDARVTKIGRFLRRTHLDELGQLFDVFAGNMTFVGTRPEIPSFADRYTPEMRATLLLPAGVTSKASLMYANEAELLGTGSPETVYADTVLPAKMRINLEELTELSFTHEAGLLFRTLRAVFGENELALLPGAEAPVRTVALMIPAYNEEEYLPGLFEDILKQTYPHDLTEVLLADSLSNDGTRALMKEFVKAHGTEYRRIRILSNTRHSQAAGWNVCLKNAETDVVIRVDAHARLPEDFIDKQVRCLNGGEYVSGGVCNRIVKEDTLWHRTLLLAENALFGSGIAPSRHGAAAQKRYVKTLSHTAYRRDVFDRCGSFDERLMRTEDNEMHYRLRKAGYRICQDTDIRTQVYMRNGLGELLKQKYGNGYWIGVTLKVCPGCLSLYHYAPAALVLAFIAAAVLAFALSALPLQILLGLYAVFAILSTLAGALKERFTPLFLFVPLLFPAMHITYGVGTWAGILFGRAKAKPHGRAGA